MHELRIIRHGHKNNDPNAHGTGVEALLDPAKIYLIREFTGAEAKRAGKDTVIVIETTPIERAKATGEIIYDSIIQHALSAQAPVMDEFLGSAGINPSNGEAVNLSPRSMSRIWADAKRIEVYSAFHGEHRPLYAWCEQGFDNPQAGIPDDPGISLREIACRIGAYIYNRVNNTDVLRENKLVLGIGHSGDIEPFLYLCLEMLQDHDGSGADAMTRHFYNTGGALEPLTGITIQYDQQHGLYLAHLIGMPYGPKREVKKSIGIEIFQEQARWLNENGKSKSILEQKLKAS